jgi:hypothetical protein
MKLIRAGLPLVASLIAAQLLAQSPRGTWNGSADAGGSSQQVTVVLDSVEAGWTGTITSSMSPSPIGLTSITLKADTLSFGIPYNGQVVWASGLVASDKFSGQLWVGNDPVGTLYLTRKAAEAEKKPPFQLRKFSLTD